MISKTGINLFTYLDYRKYLKDWYEYHKQNTTGFSFRSFSQKAGFGSPNFLKRVIEGERNLTESSTRAVIKCLELNKQESAFFERLVLFNQSTSHEEKNVHYHSIVTSQKFAQLKPLAKDQYEFCSTWYHPIVREMVVAKGFDGTPDWVAKNIRPCISADLARKSIELLARLGFIKQVGKGKWAQSEPVVTTGAEAISLTAMNYHKNVLELVKHQLPRTHPLERDVSVLTLGVAKGRLAQIKKKIQEFRGEILKLVAEDHEPDDVIMLALQLLPVSQRRKQIVSNK